MAKSAAHGERLANPGKMANLARSVHWSDVSPADWERRPFRAEQMFLNPAQVERLADVIDPRYKGLVYLGAYCGLRIGEMLGLRLKRVNPCFNRPPSACTVPPSLSAGGYGRLHRLRRQRSG